MALQPCFSDSPVIGPTHWTAMGAGWEIPGDLDGAEGETDSLREWSGAWEGKGVIPGSKTISVFPQWLVVCSDEIRIQALTWNLLCRDSEEEVLNYTDKSEKGGSIWWVWGGRNVLMLPESISVGIYLHAYMYNSDMGQVFMGQTKFYVLEASWSVCNIHALHSSL